MFNSIAPILCHMNKYTQYINVTYLSVHYCVLKFYNKNQHKLNLKGLL